MPDQEDLPSKKPEQEGQPPTDKNAEGDGLPESYAEALPIITERAQGAADTLGAQARSYEEATTHIDTAGIPALEAAAVATTENMAAIDDSANEQVKAAQAVLATDLQALNLKTAEAQATREFFADGDNMTKLGEAKARSNADIPSTPINFQSGNYAESIQANIAEAVQVRAEAAVKDKIEAIAKTKGLDAKEADFDARVAALPVEPTAKEAAFDTLMAALPGEPVKEEKKRVEKMAKPEGPMTEQEVKVYDTLKKTRDTLAAYQIPEFKPTLSKLNADLNKLSPRELVAKYTGEEEVGRKDEKGNFVLDEEGKVMTEKIPRRLIPEKAIIAARIRLEAELGKSTADVLKEIEQADESAKTSFSKRATDSAIGDVAIKNAVTSTVDAINNADHFDVINLPFKMAKLPFQGIAAAVKLPFKKLITVPAMLGTRAVGNMSRAAYGRVRYGVDTPLMQKSEIQQVKSFLTVDRTVEQLQGLEQLTTLNENFGNNQFDVAIAEGKKQAQEAGTYTEKKPAYEDTDAASAENKLYARLLSKVIDGINEGSGTDDKKKAICEAIAKTPDPKTLFTIDAANGSATFTMGEVTKTIDAKTVQQEKTIATDYLGKHEKTLREVVKVFAQRFTGNDTAMYEAIQNGQFSSKFDDRGKWVLRVQVDRGSDLEVNEIAVDAKFSEVVLKGIADKRVGEGTNELPLEYITGQIKGLEPWTEAGGRKGPTQAESAPDQAAAKKATPDNVVQLRTPDQAQKHEKASQEVVALIISLSGNNELIEANKFIADNPGKIILAELDNSGALTLSLKTGDARVIIDPSTYHIDLKQELKKLNANILLDLEALTPQRAAA